MYQKPFINSWLRLSDIINLDKHTKRADVSDAMKMDVIGFYSTRNDV
jgi:hypothetical protein